MCGRYTLTIDNSTIEHRFGAKFYIAEPSYDWSPTFNASPSQMLPIKGRLVLQEYTPEDEKKDDDKKRSQRKK